MRKLIFLTLILAASLGRATPSLFSVRYPDSHCNPLYLKESLAEARKSGVTNPEYFSGIRSRFFNHCEGAFDSIHSYDPFDILSLIELKNLGIRYNKHPAFKKHKINLQRGSFQSYLGLKPGNVKRPMVIFRCGNLCNGEDSLAAMAVKSFYDSAPFHLMILPNLLSADMINQTQRIALGGLVGGIELVEIVDQLKNDFPDKIHSFHLVGTSLGALDALFGGVYASKMKKTNIKSVTAMCPISDIHGSLSIVESDQSSSLQEWAWEGSLVATEKKLDDDIAVAAQFKLKIRDDSLKEVVAWLESVARSWVYESYFAKTPEDPYGLEVYRLGQEKLRGINPNSNLAFRDLNDLSSFVNNIEIPTLFWSAQNDSIVGSTTPSWSSSGSRWLSYLNTPYGEHCGFFAYYGWGIQNTLLQEHVLANSPGFESSSSMIQIDLSDKKIISPRVGQILWTFRPASDFVFLNVMSVNGTLLDSVELPLNEIVGLEIKTPRSMEEVFILEQWANTHFQIRSSDGRPLIGFAIDNDRNYLVHIPDWTPLH